MRLYAMLKQINTLPSPQRQLPFMNRDRQLRLRQSRSDVRRHIVRPLRGMPVQPRVLRDQAREEIGQIGHYIGIGVLLNHQRRRSVLAKHGQQSGVCFVAAQPAFNLSSEIVQPFAVRRDVKLMSELLHSRLYSTVTLLARLRG